MNSGPAPVPALEWLDSVDSTQDELLRRLAHVRDAVPEFAGTPDPADGAEVPGAPHGLAVATADQRAGRGRHGRVWTAAAGSALALSVHLRPRAVGGGPVPTDHLSWISLVAAGAVADLLAGLGADVHVKWPNDVLAADGRKLCGVLATLAPTGGVVVGMGVNLDHSAGAPAPTATALNEWVASKRVPAARDLAERLRQAVVSAVDAFAAALGEETQTVDGTHPAVAGIVRRLSTLGRRVRAELPDGTALEGVAVGLGAGGTLRVEPAPESAAEPLAEPGAAPRERERLVREISAGDVIHLRGDVRRAR